MYGAQLFWQSGTSLFLTHLWCKPPFSKHSPGIFRLHHTINVYKSLNNSTPFTVLRTCHWIKAATMLFRFAVILTPESSDVKVFVLGSREEMGQWDLSAAVPMTASQKLLSTLEPCLWTGDMQLAEPYEDTLWFKFVKRVRGTYIWEGIHQHSDSASNSVACQIRLLTSNTL